MTGTKAAYRKQRLELISLYSSSGLTAKEFCKQHNFPEYQFYYWIKRLKEKKVPLPSKAVNNFVPVKVKKEEPKKVSDLTMEIVCPNGITLRFYSPVDFAELRSLIK